MVIITVDLRPAFTRIRSAANNGLKVFVVNGRGDYLVHPDPTREFGFEIGMRFRVQDDYPDIVPVPDPNDAAPQVMRDQAGTQFGVGWGTVGLADGPRVAVIETIPYAGLIAAAIAIRDSSLFAGLLAVLGAVALAVLLARSLTRPLVQMTRAVEGFARDEPAAIPIDAGGEIGRLAQAFFARMADEVRDKTAACCSTASAWRAASSTRPWTASCSDGRARHHRGLERADAGDSSAGRARRRSGRFWAT